MRLSTLLLRVSLLGAVALGVAQYWALRQAELAVQRFAYQWQAYGQLRFDECERRKSQLETYRRATSVVETDALGRRHEYDPEQKARLLQIGEQQVLNACGSQG